MKKSTSFALSAALLAVSSGAFAATDVSANVEIDSTNRAGSAVADNDKGLGQGGRVEVNISGKAGDSGFVAGRASLIANKTGGASTDDMWVQIGNSAGDIKLGRFEAADLFPLISDTLVAHAGSVYAANNLRGRAGNGSFQAAGTVNLGTAGSLEIGLIDATKTEMNNASSFAQNTGVNAKGARVVLSLGSGALSGRIGFEGGEYKPAVAGGSANKVQGFGVTATYDAGSFKLTGNYAKGLQDAAANNNQQSYALSVGVGSFGAGYVAATNDQAGGDIKVNTLYAAYSFPLFGVKGASITPAISTSTLKDSVLNTTKDENDFRVRVHYDF